MTTLDRLQQLLTKPASAPSQPDLDRLRAALGTSLPTDYVEFLRLYGAGTIDGYLFVYGDVATDRYVDLAKTNTEDGGALWAERTMQLQDADEVPYPLWPEPGGLISCGRDANGEGLFWLTTDPDPDRWMIVAGGRQGEWIEHPGSLTSFLVGLLDETIRVPIFASDWPESLPARFEPFRTS